MKAAIAISLLFLTGFAVSAATPEQAVLAAEKSFGKAVVDGDVATL